VSVAPDLVDLGHARSNHWVDKSLLLVFNRCLPLKQEINEVSIRHVVPMDHLLHIFNKLFSLRVIYKD